MSRIMALHSSTFRIPIFRSSVVIMSGSAGYSLDQLLEWCTQDGLIDGFTKNGEIVSITLDGVEKRLDHVAARKYLKSIFTGVARGSGGRPIDRDSESNAA